LGSPYEKAMERRKPRTGRLFPDGVQYCVLASTSENPMGCYCVTRHRFNRHLIEDQS
jgi:hypothetical protein